ncbi:MAG TPA: hypothetical protein VMM59_03660 [Thermohalobaculum sp.]|nr:hypothetical protein [Thermohalobaculum sp.]
MDIKSSKTAWVESLFDVSGPYLYILVLPALVMFAMGFRTQAIVFAIGGAGFLAVMNSL